mmetsp:Transcript_9851/g.20046  ORF Transcript_9851/g.20046 Transcript_9851/m.20046 type:complete len:87 (+) Transcript_9851:177-437(+)
MASHERIELDYTTCPPNTASDLQQHMTPAGDEGQKECAFWGRFAFPPAADAVHSFVISTRGRRDPCICKLLRLPRKLLRHLPVSLK